MTLEALLTELHRRDIRLRLVAGGLEVDAAPQALTPVLREALRQHRDTLVATIQSEETERPNKEPVNLLPGGQRVAERLAAFALLCSGAPSDATDALAAVLSASKTEHENAVRHVLDVSPDFAALRAEALGTVRLIPIPEPLPCTPPHIELVADAEPCLVCGGKVRESALCISCSPARPGRRRRRPARSTRRNSQLSPVPGNREQREQGEQDSAPSSLPDGQEKLPI